MNITKTKTQEGRMGMPVSTPISAIAGRMQQQADRETVERLRRQALRGRLVRDDQLPLLVFDALYNRQWQYQATTGLVLLTVDCRRETPASVCHRVSQLPTTVLAFTAFTGCELHVVVLCRPADGPLPSDAAAHQLFVRQATTVATRYVEALCACTVVTASSPARDGGDLPRHSCRMSSDAALYFNAHATPLPVVNAAPTVLQPYAAATADECRRKEAVRTFYILMKRAREDSNDPTDCVTLLAGLCQQAGLDEEACVRRTLSHPRQQLGEDLVRSIFRSVYAQPPQGRLTSQMGQKELIARRVEQFFERRYELRYNELKQLEEYRPRTDGQEPWLPLTDRDLRRIAFEEMKDEGVAWSIDIELYVRSSLVPAYNPVHAWLARLPRWNRRTDYIRQLARRVPTRWAFWPDAFHRWLLATVAQWLGMSRDYGNALVPMLIGGQGTHKTTFCRQLLPPELREYFIDDVKMDNAEQVERMLSRMALVCIDEYNAKTPREQAKIKRLLTEKDVQSRRMRSDQWQLRQRMASFIATTNERQPLTDPTGSRRYLCCEVSGIIDTDTPVAHGQVYAQALWELQHGAAYHFSKAEESQIEEHNRQYQEMSSPQVVLTSIFEPAERSKDNFLRAIDIQQELRRHVRGADVPSIKALTLALKECGFQHGCYNSWRGWYAKTK